MDRVYRPYIEQLQNGVFLDLGCNIGLWSIYASKYASKVYAFEPARETWELAIKNLESEKIKNVSLFQEAVGHENGEASFYRNTNSTMNSMNELVKNTDVVTKVPTVTLDRVVEREKIEHIDFAKIDVEGTEDKLFASEGFTKIVPILDAFVYEYHSWCAAPYELINRRLEDLGYSLVRIPSEAVIFGARKNG